MDMLHRAMPHVLLHRLRMAIEMARNRGAFVLNRHLFNLTIVAKDHDMVSIKINGDSELHDCFSLCYKLVRMDPYWPPPMTRRDAI
jgi:hypothetical protein